MAALDKKLDLILVELQALGPIQNTLEALKSSICDVKEDIKNIQFEVGEHSDRLLALEKDMLEQKDMSNRQQQQLCALTLGLLNFPVTFNEAADNNTILKARVYEVILRPLLVTAKAAKDLSSVPQMANVIETCFRPFNATALPIPPQTYHPTLSSKFPPGKSNWP